jgi:hypothetical protein
MAPAIPLVVAALSGFTWWRLKRRNYGKMTPERAKVFEAALKTLKDPVKLEKLAQGFQDSGLKAEATELRKRAKYYAAPKEVKEKYKETFRKSLSSTDPQKVTNAARAFHKVGMYGAAEKLKQYAGGLDAPMGPGGMPPQPKKAIKTG